MCAKKYFNEPLAHHTTFKIGGAADSVCVPRNRKELIEIVKLCKKNRIPFCIIGRGSNVLMCDEGFRGMIIKNTQACGELEVDGTYVRVGSSVTLQKLVTFCTQNNLYGMHYLFCVPGTVGGAIYMNAGRGQGLARYISNHVVSVEIFDGQKTKQICREECSFGYRSSIFHRKKEWIILSVLLDLPKQNNTIGIKNINERIAFVKSTQDLEYPNGGSVFKQHFQALPEIIGHRIGNAMFSVKTPGWIINLGGATFKDVYKLIKYAIDCHKRNNLPIPMLELIIIEQSKWITFISKCCRLVSEKLHLKKVC